MRCLCCGKEFDERSSPEEIVMEWHYSCIKKFFGTKNMPDVDISEQVIEQLAIESTNKGYTVPGVQKKLSLHLSEAYDMLPVNVIMPQDKDQLALTLNGKKQDIRRKDFLVFADTCGLNRKSAEKMIEKIITLKGTYIKMCRESYLPDDMKESFEALICERIAVLD